MLIEGSNKARKQPLSIVFLRYRIALWLYIDPVRHLSTLLYEPLLVLYVGLALRTSAWL